MPRFSVIIPLYNKEGFIEKTLKSVLDQTFKDFEVIIVNDCSTDNSLAISKKSKDDRIQFVEHTINKGLSASRNTGVRHSKADFVAFLDADDLWKPTFLEKIDFLISTYAEASLFAAKYEVLLSNNKLISYDFKIGNFNTHGLIPNFFKSNLNQSIYYPSCLCVHKKVFEEVGLYREEINYSEDVDFNIRAHASYKLAYWNEPLVTYLLISENQITQNSLLGKTIPDYDFYEEKFKDRQDIKKYLDFQRYLKAKLFKLSGDLTTYKKLKSSIDPSNLNAKQRFLLHAPKIVLKSVSHIKGFLQKLGVEVNSY